jgi:U3 small nucleolar RNA-associated protein 22
VPEGNVRRAALLARPNPGGTPVLPPKSLIFEMSNLSPSGKYDFKKLACWIRIIPFISNDSPISLHRLSPSHRNLRDPSSDQMSASPSPRYNNDLLLCTTPSAHLLLLHLLCSEVPAFRDAVTLLRVWANQRGYGPSQSAVSGFDSSLSGAWWSFLMAYLVWGDDETSLAGEAATGGPMKRRNGRRTVGKNLSSYQLFRAALDLLGEVHATWKCTLILTLFFSLS